MKEKVKGVDRNLRILNIISKNFGISEFYSINISEYAITLQGCYSNKLAQKISNLGISMVVGGNGYLVGRYKNIEITLT